MEFSKENINIISTRLERFMNIYYSFLSVDLYVSLRPKFSYDAQNNSFKTQNGGREIPLLIYLYGIFQVTFSIKYKNVDSIYDAVESMVNQYEKECKQSHEHINTEKLYDVLKYKDGEFNKSIIKSFINNSDNIQTIQYFNKATTSISNCFIEISDELSKVEQFGKLALGNNKVMYNIQALNEFNNAMSHLFMAFISKDDDNLNNISKAMTHLHRGTLDIMKNYLQFIKLNNNTNRAYTNARYNEFSSIGNKTIDYNKEFILFEYINLISEVSNSYKSNIQSTLNI